MEDVAGGLISPASPIGGSKIAKWLVELLMKKYGKDWKKYYK